MGAGDQFKGVWIPAYAGMTDRYPNSKLNNILYDISGTQRYIFFKGEIEHVRQKEEIFKKRFF
jgi:hypothetical protein